MCCGFPRSRRTVSGVFAVLQRRLSAEWNLLSRLAVLNPGRLTGLVASDAEFCGTLVEPAARLVASGAWEKNHSFRLLYPVHFPAAPMELYLQQPVRHPNVHPETGFVCLWDRHRVSHTAEHAMHRLAAMLAGKLYNREAVHVMQPDALRYETCQSEAEAYLLQGVTHGDLLPAGPVAMRRRLS